MLRHVLAPIVLECSRCGATESYARGLDPKIPDKVTRIVSMSCVECESEANDDDVDGYLAAQEVWLDKDGNEVAQI